MSQLIQEANGISLTVEGGGVTLFFGPNAIIPVSDSVYNSTAVQDALTAGEIIDADEVEAPSFDAIPHQFNNLFPVASYGTPTATELQLRFRESLGGFEDSDGNLYSAGSTFITFRVEMIDEDGNFLLWEGLRGADPSDGSVVLTLTDDEKFKSGQSYPDTLGAGSGEYDLTGASLSDFIIVAEVSGGASGIGNMQSIVTVAKSGGEYTLIQDGIDAASPSVQSGTAQAGAASAITLATGASDTDDYYNGMQVRLDGGTGDGQIRSIIDYVGSTKVATVDSDWDINPDATTTYDVKSVITVLVGPGEYNEAITPKDCVDIVAVDPEATVIGSVMTASGSVSTKTYIRANLTYLYVQGGNGLDEVTLDGDVDRKAGGSIEAVNITSCASVVINGNIRTRSTSSSNALNIASANTGDVTINGNIESIDNAIVSCVQIQGSGTYIINGDITFDTDASGAGIPAVSTVSAFSGTLTIINSKIWCNHDDGFGEPLAHDGGTVLLRNCILENDNANAFGRCIAKDNNSVLRMYNVNLICTHASAEAIWANNAEDVSCYGVYGNRVLNTNITNLVANGFKLSDGTNTDVESITATSGGVAADLNTTTTLITTNGDQDEDNVTLADGQVGQIKKFAVIAEGDAADTIKITPANLNGGTQITFSATPVGEGCEMLFDGTAWNITSNNGGTIA